MRTTIVFESMFGNTESFAQVIADGLAQAGAEATLGEVRRIAPGDLSGCDLLVIGAPTHAFSMSRQSTREDAFPSVAARPVVAVFDTQGPPSFGEIDRAHEWGVGLAALVASQPSRDAP